jgi:outer membrane protein assembly factor BamB
MKSRRPILRLTLCGLAPVLLVLPARAGDWPQFRGPHRDGISQETVRTDWGETGPPVIWRAPLGQGYSGISEVDGRLYTLYGRGTDTWAVALDAGTGREIWRYRLDDFYRDGQGNGPRSTPTIQDGVVYALSAQATLAALDAKTGKEIWARDLKEAYGARVPTWGAAVSPLVEDGRIYLDVGGPAGYSVMALDAKTGEAIWGSQNDIPGYSAPVIATIHGQRHLVVFTGTQIVGLDPDHGRRLWRKGWRTSYDVNAATPIFVPPDRIFVASGYGVGGALLAIRRTEGGWSADEVWKSRGMKNQFSSSIVHRGTLYGFDDGTLKALDVDTGDERWKVRGFGHGSITLAGDHLVVLGDRGQLAVVAATPEEYRVEAETRIFQGKTWTVPTVTDGRMYLRDEKEIVALDVAARKD